MEQWLGEYPEMIELVICNNDDMALGAIDAMERAEIDHIKLVGIDATTPGQEAVRSGKLLGTVSADKEQYAGAIFSIAAAKAQGEPLPSELSLENGKYYWSPQEILVNP